MSGGEWLIRQRGLEPHRYSTIRVTVDTASGTADPIVNRQFDLIGLWLEYADGRIHIFPWANIISAEYRPHPQP